ncbi:MAG: cytochrome c3 family protein [Burkholderiales bacterium]|jgi:hypothetical protein|nr:cytochrome c3 family protein [Burkholderiales bacterium]
MILKRLFILASAAFFSAMISLTALAEPATATTSKHANKGIACVLCHKENPPAKTVPFEQCENCHGDNDTMAKRTEKTSPNPHYNHLGNVTCTECHRDHTESVLICDDCHKFKLKTP